MLELESPFYSVVQESNVLVHDIDFQIEVFHFVFDEHFHLNFPNKNKTK